MCRASRSREQSDLYSLLKWFRRFVKCCEQPVANSNSFFHVLQADCPFRNPCYWKLARYDAGGYHDDVVTKVKLWINRRTHGDFFWAWSSFVTMPATTSVRRRCLLKETTE